MRKRYSDECGLLDDGFDDFDDIKNIITPRINVDYENDPADNYDIFPAYLREESKFYPKSWGR